MDFTIFGSGWELALIVDATLASLTVICIACVVMTALLVRAGKGLTKKTKRLSIRKVADSHKEDK